jgi:hypothetical protein
MNSNGDDCDLLEYFKYFEARPNSRTIVPNNLRYCSDVHDEYTLSSVSSFSQLQCRWLRLLPLPFVSLLTATAFLLFIIFQVRKEIIGTWRRYIWFSSCCNGNGNGHSLIFLRSAIPNRRNGNLQRERERETYDDWANVLLLS